MKKRIIATLVLGGGLLWATPAHAVTPVVDVKAIAELVNMIKVLKEQLGILEDQLAEMRFQARVSEVPWNEDTNALLAEMANTPVDDGLFYGNHFGEWDEIFQGSVNYPQGGWLGLAKWRGEALLKTQKALGLLLSKRQESFADDQRRIEELQATLDGALSRNQLIKATGAVQAELVRQLQMSQQGNMVSANAEIVAAAYQANERLAREAQERGFMTNFGEDIPEPVAHDWGIY